MCCGLTRKWGCRKMKVDTRHEIRKNRFQRGSRNTILLRTCIVRCSFVRTSSSFKWFQMINPVILMSSSASGLWIGPSRENFHEKRKKCRSIQVVYIIINPWTAGGLDAQAARLDAQAACRKSVTWRHGNLILTPEIGSYRLSDAVCKFSASDSDSNYPFAPLLQLASA